MQDPQVYCRTKNVALHKILGISEISYKFSERLAQVLERFSGVFRGLPHDL